MRSAVDWDNLRFFLAVARLGNLTAASRELQVVQTTVGRRLAALEESHGTKLLERTPDGYLLTMAGESVRVQAERIEAQAQSLIRSASGADIHMRGQVRIACTNSIATHVLAPRLGDFHIRHPGMLIEIHSNVERLSLAMREADIAIRLNRTDKNELVTKRIGRLAYGLYASHAYVEKTGAPNFRNGCAEHSIITLIGDDSSVMPSDWLMSMTSRALPGLACGSLSCLVAAAAVGGGVACIPRFLGDRQMRLRLLPTPISAPKAEIWMLVHDDIRRFPRIKAVVSVLTEAFKAASSVLDPHT